MNEANTDISRLSGLAARTSRTRARQEPVAADKYLEAFMKIIPKEFKAVAVTLLDAKAQKIRRDLDPHDFMDALEPIRYSIDESFQRTASRQHNTNPRVRKVAMDPDRPSWTTTGNGLTEDSDTDQEATQGNKQQSTKKGFHKYKQKNTDKKEDSECKLCGNPNHDAKKCPLFILSLIHI